MGGTKSWRILLVTGVTLASLAGAQQQSPPPQQPRKEWPDFENNTQAKLMRTMTLAEALQLNETDTLKLRSTLESFDARRKPLHKEMAATVQVIRRAAHGDRAAYPQVDSAIAHSLELRQQIQQLDRELLATLALGQPPQAKAKLALAMARLPRQMRDLMRENKQDE